MLEPSSPANGRAAPQRDQQSLQEMLGVNRNELEILMRLVAWSRLAREQVPAIAMCGHRPVKIGSVSAIMLGLRKKLARYGIELATIREFGWGLHQKDRNKIVALIEPKQAPGAGAKTAGTKSDQEVELKPKAA